MSAKLRTVQIAVAGFLSFLVLTVCSTGIVPLWAAEPSQLNEQNRAVVKKALAEFNSIIDGWRGTGQPRRGSARGAWQETATWVWNFKKNSISIHYIAKNSKLLDSAIVTYDPKRKVYRMKAKMADKTERELEGKLKEKTLTLESKPDKKNEVYRISITMTNPKRLNVLHEKRPATRKTYSRIAGVGYTRKGTRLASSDQSGPKCIVSGGAGTTKVSYKGKTYYVCCSGCRTAFEDDPEGIIAQAKKEANEKKKKAKKG